MASDIIKMSDTPRTPDLSLNAYLLQVHQILLRLSGGLVESEQVITLQDLRDLGLISQETTLG